MIEHPPPDALRVPDEAVRAHLRECPRCRLDARLLSETTSLDGLDEARSAMARARSDASRSLSETLAPPEDDGQAPLLPTGEVVDGYQVHALIGTGAMAEVYRVSRGGETFALKVVTVPGRGARERLMREARTLSALRHRNVVTLWDVVDTRFGPGLVLEYVAGPSLHGLLRHRPLTLAQADALALDILDGVAACHAAGLVHRDLKPANILIQPAGDGVVAKVADFGLVKALGGDGGSLRTRTGALAGTPPYMAPEQIRDASRVDERADVFSLGAVLYELVSGRRAFDGIALLDIFERVRAGRHAPLDDLPPRVQAAVGGALRPDRDERTPTVEALRRAWGGSRGAVFPEELTRWIRDQAQRSQQPVTRSVSAAPTTDLVGDDPWLGRTALVDRARAALEAGRPVTWTGPDGSGRAELAQQVGGDVADAARGLAGEEVLELGPLGPVAAAALFERLGGRGPRAAGACRLPLAIALDAAQPARLTGADLPSVLAEVWGRLDGEVRGALSRCAAFDGPFTLEQAEGVVQTEEWVLDLLQEAVQLRLLTWEEPRFAMHPAVRRFARGH